MNTNFVGTFCWVAFTLCIAGTQGSSTLNKNLVIVPKDQTLYMCHNILIVPPENTERDRIENNTIVTSAQIHGILHKVLKVKKSDGYAFNVVEPVSLDEALVEVDTTDDTHIELLDSIIERTTDHSLVECLTHYNKNGVATAQGSSRIGYIVENTNMDTTEDSQSNSAPNGHYLVPQGVEVRNFQGIKVAKCMGHQYKHAEGTFYTDYIVFENNENIKLEIGDIAVAEETIGFIEDVVAFTHGDGATYVNSRLSDCEEFVQGNRDLSIKWASNSEEATYCQGGKGDRGVIILSNNTQANLVAGDTIIGRQSGRIAGEIVQVTKLGKNTILEVALILRIDNNQVVKTIKDTHAAVQAKLRVRNLEMDSRYQFYADMSLTKIQETTPCTVFSASVYVDWVSRLDLGLKLQPQRPFMSDVNMDFSSNVHASMSFRMDSTCNEIVNEVHEGHCDDQLIFQFCVSLGPICVPTAVHKQCDVRYTIKSQGTGFVSYGESETGQINIAASWLNGSSNSPPEFEATSTVPAYDGGLTQGSTVSSAKLEFISRIEFRMPPQGYYNMMSFFGYDVDTIIAPLISDLLQDIGAPQQENAGGRPVFKYAIEVPLSAEVEVLSCPDPAQCNHTLDNQRVSLDADFPANISGHVITSQNGPSQQVFTEYGRYYNGYKCFESTLQPDCPEEEEEEHGDPHGTTLDNRKYSYQGTNNYLISAVSPKFMRDVLAFKITAKNTLIKGTTRVEIATLFIYKRKYAITHHGQLKVDGKVANIPYDDDKVKVVYKKVPNLKGVLKGAVSLSSKEGIQLQLGLKEHLLLVEMPGHYRGKVFGMGQNFNGRKEDDYFTCQGQDLRPPKHGMSLMKIDDTIAESCEVDDEGRLLRTKNQ